MEHPHDPDPGGPDPGDHGPGHVDGPGFELPDIPAEPDLPGGPDLDPVGPDPIDPIDRDHDGGPHPGGPGPGGTPAGPDPAAPEPAPGQPPSEVGGVHGPGVDDDPAPVAPAPAPAPRGDLPVELPDGADELDTDTDVDTDGGLVGDGLDAGDVAPSADTDAGDEVRLDLDLGPGLDDGDDGTGADSTDGADDADAMADGELILPLDGPLEAQTEPFAPAPDNGWLTQTLLASALGTAAAAALVRRAGGGRLSSRRAVASMEEQGVDARVEHGSMAALSEWLASPTQSVRVAVHAAGGEPTVCTVVAVDDASSTVLLEEPGPMGMRFDVRLDEFERSWADTAYEALVAEQDGRSVRTLPVTLGGQSLLSPGW
jgi:hypothetical protein